MPRPLNPTLFHTLQAQFGEVRISNAGQPRITRRVPDPARPGHFMDRATQRGEQYAIPCMFCGDDRFRLYVSYMYGEKDRATGHRNFGLWFCQNERCHQSEGNRQILRSRLAVPLGRRHSGRVASAQQFCSGEQNLTASAPTTPQPIILPEGLIPITALPETHPAPAYLLQRGFDLQYLQDVWDVSFCDWCLACRPLVSNRIVIPVYRPAQLFSAATEGQQPVLAGWQARAVPGIEPLGGSDAKYLSAEGMQKSELLYGLHLALATKGPVYLVEGATDAWRIGPGAVALFGKDLSQTQKLLLVHHFVGRPILVLLDPDAHEAAERVQHELHLARGGLAGDNRVILVELPPGTEDPAACTPEEIQAAANRALG